MTTVMVLFIEENFYEAVKFSNELERAGFTTLMVTDDQLARRIDPGPLVATADALVVVMSPSLREHGRIRALERFEDFARRFKETAKPGHLLSLSGDPPRPGQLATLTAWDVSEGSMPLELVQSLEAHFAPSDTASQPPDLPAVSSPDETVAAGYVFISYSHDDEEYVDRLKARLEKNGVRTWTDSQIAFGSSFRREIRDAINDCAAFVVVMSTDSEDSIEIESELEWALRKNKPVLPLLLSGDGFLRLATHQHLDVTDGSIPGEAFTKRLVELVAAASG